MWDKVGELLPIFITAIEVKCKEWNVHVLNVQSDFSDICKHHVIHTWIYNVSPRKFPYAPFSSFPTLTGNDCSDFYQHRLVLSASYGSVSNQSPHQKLFTEGNMVQEKVTFRDSAPTSRVPLGKIPNSQPLIKNWIKWSPRSLTGPTLHLHF